jgi:threonyl-tRNA synthetase
MQVTLPDGAKLDLPDGATGLDAARAIGPKLAEATAAVEVDGSLRDLRLPLADGARLRILRVGDDDALRVLRHSTAHVLAEAVKHLYPSAKIAIGPAIDDGFYYDFEFPEGPPGEADLERIEAEMRRILAAGPYPIERRLTTRDEAVARFRDEHEPYKVELAEGLAEGEEITEYTQDGFVDLCRGPHLQDTKPIRVFKLTSLAGAYWRGDSRNTQLTRIYGTAFFTQKDLDEHLHRLEEARRRDHRRLGAQLDLFHFSEDSPGSPFWHPKGMAVWNALTAFWREQNALRGYREVRTPILFDSELWKRSGHWDNYRENMFFSEVDDRIFGLKPMNCPGHVEIYNHTRRSYRDLPLRLAEQGLVHRNEASGVMHGLLRVRHITQDDAHIFCTWDQVEDEVIGCLELAAFIYETLGLPVRAELSTRPDKRIGSEEQWDRMEAALAAALARAGWDYRVNAGDGAFYAPKIDLHMTDSIGRGWQMGTIQLDAMMPDRFDATYTSADDRQERPFMIHRALFGSFERFIGILIEHFAGAFPVWLAPVQAVVLPISDSQQAYGEQVRDALLGAGLRATLDDRDEKVGRKIRDAEEQKVPAMLVVGEREAEAREVSLRRHGRRNLGARPLDAVAAALAAENTGRWLDDREVDPVPAA